MLFLESNHDEDMLEQGRLSASFKKPHKRGGEGHFKVTGGHWIYL